MSVKLFLKPGFFGSSLHVISRASWLVASEERHPELTAAQIADLRVAPRHASVRGTTGRSARKTWQPASHRASHRTRGRTGGRGRARRTHHDQHRPQGSNL